MEMTWDEWKVLRKDLRRRFSSTGWILLVYYGIMNVAVGVAVFVESMVKMMVELSSGNIDAMMEVATDAAGSAWGYFVAAAIGTAILLLWKKPKYFREEIMEKGKPMTVGSFFAILCIFLSGQMVFQILATVFELVLNVFGLSMLEGMNELAMDTDEFSMFLYAGILAPVTEEILFRGLIQKSLMPYGKKFAIFCSAFTFGIFHGNLIQSPYAFAVGLVLGYVASEYSILWAMVLHMINNLVIADMLSRLTSGLPETAANLIVWFVIAAFTLAAIIIAIVKRRRIGEYLHQEKISGAYLRCFFSSAGIITLTIVMGLNMLLTLFLIIKPL